MKWAVTTDRGERVELTIYRAGDATLTVQQSGDWRTAFMSREQMQDLFTFLSEWQPEPPFTGDQT